MSRDRVLERVAAEDVEFTRFLWVDHNSVLRGKAVTAPFLADRMESGIGLARSRQAANVLDVSQPVPGFNAVGEVRLLPDPDSFVVLPHLPAAAGMLCDLVELDGTPWDACPRSFLRGAVEAAGELDVVAAFEPEFALCKDKPVPGDLTLLDDSLCFDNTGFDAGNEFAVELSRSLRAQGIDTEIYHPEFGAGQHELTLRHAPALRAADNYVWHRAMARGLAAKQGIWATFAPSPKPGFRGNGNHLHLSLWRGGTNAFHDAADPFGLSVLARHFIAGVLAHMPALVALTCASVNSYQRLQPGHWSGAYAGWGPDNREAAVRIPSMLRGRESESVNIEFKASDSTANPYLALGALIHAGLDGVRRELDPGAPLTEDPNTVSEKRLRELGIEPLPRSLEEAVDALERDEHLMSVLGPARSVLYPAIKRSDVRDMKELGTELEYFTYATRY
ncbi:glutamine synthetase family protein [Lentzea sp. NPDC003310]|uniref:glutamine synthetase family protein n=1 Tax=Lentzea sp. NPDC003310 TaxID=3154447 RepID=UPI0033A41F8B